MKFQLTIFILLSLVTIGNGQMKDTSYFDGCNWTTCKGGSCQTTLLACTTSPFFEEDSIVLPIDSLTAERFIQDSLDNKYEIEYRYTDDIQDKYTHAELKDTHEKKLNKYYEEHQHYIALVNIISFKGNHKKIIAENIKAIYSPTECSADNSELWKQKINQILNNKKQ